MLGRGFVGTMSCTTPGSHAKAMIDNEHKDRSNMFKGLLTVILPCAGWLAALLYRLKRVMPRIMSETICGSDIIVSTTLEGVSAKKIARYSAPRGEQHVEERRKMYGLPSKSTKRQVERRAMVPTCRDWIFAGGV